MMLLKNPDALREDAMLASKPVFIGNFRSGTTLLINLLGLHADVAPWFETKGLCEPLRWLRVLEDPETLAYEAAIIHADEDDAFSAEAVASRMLEDIRNTAARIEGTAPHGKGQHERYPLGHDCVLYSVDFAEQAVHHWLDAVRGQEEPEAVAAATGSLITRLGQRQAQLAGKPLWVNKTPEISRFAAELRQCLGPVRMILMVRHGRDVVRSAERLGWAGAPEIVAWWRGMIEQSRAASAGHEGDYLEMKFENLLQDPSGELNRALSFLALDPSGEHLVSTYSESIGMDHPVGPRRGLHLGSYDTAPSTVIDTLIDQAFLRSLGYET